MKSKLVESTPKSLRLVESKEKRKGCLGRLEGICADFIHPTRNNMKIIPLRGRIGNYVIANFGGRNNGN